MGEHPVGQILFLKLMSMLKEYMNIYQDKEGQAQNSFSLFVQRKKSLAMDTEIMNTSEYGSLEFVATLQDLAQDPDESVTRD